MLAALSKYSASVPMSAITRKVSSHAPKSAGGSMIQRSASCPSCPRAAHSRMHTTGSETIPRSGTAARFSALYG